MKVASLRIIGQKVLGWRQKEKGRRKKALGGRQKSNPLRKVSRLWACFAIRALNDRLYAVSYLSWKILTKALLAVPGSHGLKPVAMGPKIIILNRLWIYPEHTVLNIVQYSSLPTAYCLLPTATAYYFHASGTPILKKLLNLFWYLGNSCTFVAE